MLDLKAIRERCEKANSLPWTKITQYRTQEDNYPCYGAIQMTPSGWNGIHYTRDSDGEFIAHSRSDMEQLLEAVEEAREIIQRFHAITKGNVTGSTSAKSEAWLARFK